MVVKRLKSSHLIATLFLLVMLTLGLAIGGIQVEANRRADAVAREAKARSEVLAAESKARDAAFAAETQARNEAFYASCRDLRIKLRDTFTDIISDFVRNPTILGGITARLSDDFNPDDCVKPN